MTQSMQPNFNTFHNAHKTLISTVLVCLAFWASTLRPIAARTGNCKTLALAFATDFNITAPPSDVPLYHICSKKCSALQLELVQYLMNNPKEDVCKKGTAGGVCKLDHYSKVLSHHIVANTSDRFAHCHCTALVSYLRIKDHEVDGISCSAYMIRDRLLGDKGISVNGITWQGGQRKGRTLKTFDYGIACLQHRGTEQCLSDGTCLQQLKHKKAHWPPWGHFVDTVCDVPFLGAWDDPRYDGERVNE
ncbi:hypothetical protein BCR37DRAFT_388914 [Protomyces lactucae-debilis]|uniref:Uncharacterized protein n=1 Tax=Protomyces lactucae-debilis TaxID=2754530 RepID=A0A1Y2F2U0_PROLT|nr:uncharacterized protein BCR37DRAFT_388914 [Protomyces lactucae-debilis]ORY78182.1 hypothetical protein BCR37DRAFT_388914 [Protomyces lactucae-debilis]